LSCNFSFRVLQVRRQVHARDPVENENGDENGDDQYRRVRGGGARVAAADALEDLQGHGGSGTVVGHDGGAELGHALDTLPLNAKSLSCPMGQKPGCLSLISPFEPAAWKW
jgi:hypothetical protein